MVAVLIVATLGLHATRTEAQALRPPARLQLVESAAELSAPTPAMPRFNGRRALAALGATSGVITTLGLATAGVFGALGACHREYLYECYTHIRAPIAVALSLSPVIIGGLTYLSARKRSRGRAWAPIVAALAVLTVGGSIVGVGLHRDDPDVTTVSGVLTGAFSVALPAIALEWSHRRESARLGVPLHAR